MLLSQPLPHTSFSALGLSVEAGLGSSLLLCDLDFKAEMVPGADSQRALSLALAWQDHRWALLSGGTWCASKSVSDQFFHGWCKPCCLAYCLFVSRCLPPRQIIILRIYSGPSRGLRIRSSGPILMQCHGSASVPLQARLETRKTGLSTCSFDLQISGQYWVMHGQLWSGPRPINFLPTFWSSHRMFMM